MPLARPDPAVLDALATLLEYPGEGFPERLRAAGGTVRSLAPEVGEPLEPFLRHAAGAAPAAVEELYAQTFDWDPVRCLDLGWHLYGEQYDRGAFLVRMRDALRRAGLEEGTELPDHLTTALRLLARLPEDEASSLAREAVLPALEKMTKGFEDGKNPYGGLVRAVRSAVATCAAPDAEAEGGAR